MRFRSARGASRGGWWCGRPAQLGTAGAFAVLALVAFVLGVIKTDNAKQVEASGPDGLQAASLITAQRGLSIPCRNQDSAAPDQGLRPAVDLALRVPRTGPTPTTSWSSRSTPRSS